MHEKSRKVKRSSGIREGAEIMGNPMTDRIAALIEKMLEENGGELEIQRNKLAKA